MVTLSPIRRCAKTGAPRPAILEPNEKRRDTEGEGGNRANLKALCALLRPSVASLGYGLFLAINAASVWGGVFPFLPLAFQTPDVMLWFSAAESVAFTATFLASAAGTWFFPAETRHFMVKAVAVPYMGGWCLLIGAMYLNGAAVGLSCAGGTLLGVGSAGFYMLWQRLFASQDAREGMGNLIAGTAWAAVLYFALYLIPVAVTAYLIPCVFLPLFGLAAVLKSRTIDLAQPMFEDVPREHGRTYRHVLATIWRPALSLGTLGLCTGIMRSLAIGDPSVGTFVNALSMGGDAGGGRGASGRVGHQKPAHQRGYELPGVLPRGDYRLFAAAASGRRLCGRARGRAVRAVVGGHRAHDDPVRPGIAGRGH